MTAETSLSSVSGFAFAAASIVGVFLCVTALPAPLAVPVVFAALVAASGLCIVDPNEGVVVTFFGRYLGTVRTVGLRWVRPFTAKKKVSLRTRTFETEPLKVNDHAGNPIEIAAIIAWRVDDTAKALFAVDDYESFTPTQSEAALRALAARYPYEATAAEPISLRASPDEIAAALAAELKTRLDQAGVVVEEARLSHLAYAPEIAAAMLQRQQAEAVVSARGRIVEGAVGIVGDALDQLEGREGVAFTPESRADLVANLLVVLCSDRPVSPVVDLSPQTRAAKRTGGGKDETPAE